MIKKIISERKYEKFGFVKRIELIDGSEFGCDDFEIKSAYTLNGDYIGDYKTANIICKNKGINPEKIHPDSCVCSIGFSEKDKKWYGWSHRAIYGFKIGSKCKIGDCNYIPKNRKDFFENCIKFWSNKEYKNVKGKFVPNGVEISWEYKKSSLSKYKISSVFCEFPEKYGNGEWKAKTMKDAKQMAIDFAKGVS